MHTLLRPARCVPALLPALLAAFVLAAPALALGGEEVGAVSRLKGQATATQAGKARNLAQGAAVFTGDTLATGQDARLEVSVQDGTVLTLGGGATFSLARYDLGRQQGPGAVLMKLVRGAFRVVSGKLEGLRGGTFEVETEQGTIGIRGTEFWGGYLEPGELSVLLVSGTGVYVRNAAGVSEITTPGDGVKLRSRDVKPSAPKTWPKEKVARAFKSVSFD